MAYTEDLKSFAKWLAGSNPVTRTTKRKKNAMGLGLRLSGSDSSWGNTVSYGPKNPNPLKFKITQVMEFKHCSVLKVNYPDATNYEGNKILVVKNTKNWGKVKKLDPHFDQLDPFLIARFAPTTRGWQDACRFASVYPK